MGAPRAQERKVIRMPWVNKPPPVPNRHTVKAQKMDRKADRQKDAFMANHYREKADKAARKGGWK
jgi:hypothetical protein